MLILRVHAVTNEPQWWSSPLGDYIRERHGHHPSVSDQIQVTRFIFGHQITPAGNEKKCTEIAGLLDEECIELDQTLRTVLNNLEEIDVIELFYPHDGNRWFPLASDLTMLSSKISTKSSRRIRAYSLPTQVSDLGGSSGRSAVADNGVTIRSVVANVFDDDVAPNEVEAHILKGDMNEQRAKLETAIDAVEYYPEVENGDRIIATWRSGIRLLGGLSTCSSNPPTF